MPDTLPGFHSARTSNRIFAGTSWSNAIPDSTTESKPVVQIFGRRGSAMPYVIRDFLNRCDVPFEWIELSDDEQARTFAKVPALDENRLPVCVFPDGTRLERPTLRQISEKLGLFRNPSYSEYDLSIYGAGPAGLSAAVYGASEGLMAVVVQRFA